MGPTGYFIDLNQYQDTVGDISLAIEFKCIDCATLQRDCNINIFLGRGDEGRISLRAMLLIS